MRCIAAASFTKSNSSASCCQLGEHDVVVDGRRVAQRLGEALELGDVAEQLALDGGRCTFTATSRGPPYLAVSVARCTCAMPRRRAARSNVEHVAERLGLAGAPRATRRSQTNGSGSTCGGREGASADGSANGSGGSTMSVSPSSASMYWRGNRSWREAMTWPVLT